MSTAERRTMSAEEYLAWKEQQETKHEFLAGLVYEVYPIAGAALTDLFEDLGPLASDAARPL